MKIIQKRKPKQSKTYEPKKALSFSTERIKTKRKTNFKQVSYVCITKLNNV